MGLGSGHRKGERSGFHDFFAIFVKEKDSHNGFYLISIKLPFLKLQIVEDTPMVYLQSMKETMKNEGQKRMDNMESFSSALKPDWTWTIWIVIAATVFATF